MRTRAFLAGGALFLSLVAVGSAKSWDISVVSPTKTGNVMLPKGDYSVKVNNDQATFRDVDSGKTYSVPVKIETADHKYSQTAVETHQQGDTPVMQCLDLGGTTEKLEFGE